MKPQYEIKSKFIFINEFFSNIIILLLLLGVGLFAFSAVRSLNTEAQNTYIYVIMIAAFVLYICYLLMKKLNMDSTTYSFFSKKVEFEEGFLTKRSKSIKFERIREIELYRPVIARIFGLGNIYLSTSATGAGDDEIFESGLKLKNIENPEAVYSDLRQLLDK